ncbi:MULTISPECIES: HPr family phosphocarrier protein [Crateriforma]|uniref:Phosphocarrier protein HPr n=1 Tax=Crateriforma conspicua TaxID=2527996 RepID=A0A5C6FJW3_9PLAN|nr:MULTISPECIES: HPr family phosphocarrier protein [Crateriforma]TWU62380.1 Phosphocarrier protein HPr [Crateriforma conspicua]
MNTSPLERTVTVVNPQGLHARPADMIVRAANKYTCNILIGKSGELVDCKSILSLLTLGATQGTELSISAQGDDAAAAIQEISALFENGFEEMKQLQDAEHPAEP